MKEKIIAAGGLIFNDKNELLMIYRRKKWDLPKGKLDEGESIEACALREVREETGLKNLQLEKIIGITLHDYINPYSNKKVVKETHWFKMHAPDYQQLIPQKEEDIEEVIWVDKKDLDEKLKNSYANIIEIIEKLNQKY